MSCYWNFNRFDWLTYYTCHVNMISIDLIWRSNEYVKGTNNNNVFVCIFDRFAIFFYFEGQLECVCGRYRIYIYIYGPHSCVKWSEWSIYFLKKTKSFEYPSNRRMLVRARREHPWRYSIEVSHTPPSAFEGSWAIASNSPGFCMEIEIENKKT